VFAENTWALFHGNRPIVEYKIKSPSQDVWANTMLTHGHSVSRHPFQFGPRLGLLFVVIDYSIARPAFNTLGHYMLLFRSELEIYLPRSAKYY